MTFPLIFSVSIPVLDHSAHAHVMHESPICIWQLKWRKATSYIEGGEKEKAQPQGVVGGMEWKGD